MFKRIFRKKKRFYLENSIYFVTVITYWRICYFNDEILCRGLLKDIIFCSQLKKFKIYGFVILPDHFHIMFRPCGAWNISQIMQSLKMNSSRNTNIILDQFWNVKANTYSPLRKRFLPYPKFKWRKSFIDHSIRGEQDFINHLEYIKKNPMKHLGISYENYRWIKIYV